MPSKNQSILLGGLVVGLLSTSYLGLINMLCCAGVLIGAVVAVWHYTSTYELTIPAGEGATIGALAALIGGLISLVLNFVLMKIGIRHDLVISQFMLERFGEGMPPEQYEQIREQMSQPVTLGSYLKQAWYGAVLIVTAIFGAIGGVLGAVLFKKGGEAPEGAAM
ncbi:DUF4199 family protein [Rhodocaloribacter litoris]|uniref:DUF4199 family protein n=1 Tax=Rhodocaloribacter litoris TaxID=2558931 RepID=UPI00141FCCCB|nr:DUF4199 family protein [Rhodocaloribacter litoris]QXD16369.1 DUF4199 family protein [Rhodocaloribacter litoris]